VLAADDGALAAALAAARQAGVQAALAATAERLSPVRRILAEQELLRVIDDAHRTLPRRRPRCANCESEWSARVEALLARQAEELIEWAAWALRDVAA
jgi:hypothetical protein